ncbi:macro domain-containing protein [Allisonella histaminiformans]|uniref:macro domain-containing protein n=2 Tax=Allisonella histaminiformans TaxID=209880 RepID=UPI002E75FC97|nr:macro domain-containing protein [Allisonella histaminiformans]
MPFFIVDEDITEMNVDAVVNAANTELRMGGGVCGAIFRAAGAEQMEKACRPLRPVKTGEAVITPGFDLPARYVIHTPGPIYREGQAEACEEQLRASYRNSLHLAEQYHCESLAFPLISSGTYGYPKKKALQVAVSTIREFLETHEMDVYLILLANPGFVLPQELRNEVDSVLKESPDVWDRMEAAEWSEDDFDGAPEPLGRTFGNVPVEAAPAAGAPDFEDFKDNLDEPFNKALLQLIDAKGKTDVEVYKKANISRKLFSKIRTGRGYMPGKRTILALAIGLELNMEETENLLEHAGFALSQSILSDVIVKYFISHKKYDIYEINDALFHYQQPLLGSA